MTSERRVPEPLYPTFPRAEIAERQRRVREGMERDGLDLLLLTERENVEYFSGLSSVATIQKGVPSAVLLIHRESDEPVMYLPDFWLGNAEKTSWINDFVLHRNSHSQADTFAPFLVDDVVRRGWGNARIGYEGGTEMLLGIPLRIFEPIRNGLASATWADGGPAIWHARKIKSPTEVAKMRASAQATGRAQERTRAWVRPGMNERDIARFFRVAIIEESDGEDQNRIFLNMRAGRERYNMADTHPKDRAVQPGEMLVIDAGIRLDGYASDVARVVSIGEPTPLSRETFPVVASAMEAALKEVRPGSPASAVYHAVRNVYDQAGYPVHVDMVGHGIGLDTHEPPMLSPTDHTPLEEGMVLCVEPWLTLANDAGVYTIESTFVVTKDGCEELSIHNERLLVSGD